MALPKDIYDKLKNAIIYGELGPGEKLSEFQLAKEMRVSRTPIREAFRQLQMEGYVSVVYNKGAYVTKLPIEEKYDLIDQMRRCSKAAPALVAEGFAKRYKPKSWKKYLEDAIGECNEMIHHLSVAQDLYSKFISVRLCGSLIQDYDTACRQLWRLHESWVDYHRH